MTTPPDTPKLYLDDVGFCKIALSILVKRMGGVVTISQADIDGVAFNRIHEEHMSDGTLRLRFEQKGQHA